MKENVLLLCLSTLNPVSRLNSYSYGGDPAAIDGYLTNEAPAKCIIRELAHSGRRLNRIVMICSDTVMTPVGNSYTGDIDSVAVPPLSDGRRILDATHAEYYQDTVSQYAKNRGSLYGASGIRFETVRIPDYTMPEDVSKAVIEASTRILESGGNVDLYIDFNGGQRYIAFMILAISSLMKIRHVNIAQVLTMNWGERDQRGRIPIHDMKDLFLTVDLAAGIKEYTNYGRTKGLKGYFGNTGNRRIRMLISEMTSMAENLQLCNTDYVMDNRGKLLKSLNEFIHDENTERNDTETILFYYVVSDILKEYQGLLDGELPGIIRWCVEHDFVQQAITFCTEQVPQYFMDNGILYPSRQEKKEFVNFLKCISERQAKREFIPDMISKTFTRPGVAQTSPLFAYYWMVNYLLFSYGDNRNTPNGYKTVTASCAGDLQQLMSVGPSKEEMQKYNKIPIPFVNASNGIKTQNRLAQKTEWYMKNTSQVRAESKVKNYMDYINMYYFLKKQRNIINHSDGEARDRWPYDLLCEALDRFAEELAAVKEPE